MLTVRVPERVRNKCERVTGPQPERFRSVCAGVNATRTSGTGPEREPEQVWTRPYPDQWSDATIIRCKLHCERVKLFVLLLGGAAYSAVSRDFRSVLHLRFYQRVYAWLSIEHAFKFKGLYFDFVYISRELFLFPDLRQWRAGQITYALVVPPRDYQLRHLAVWRLFRCSSA